MRGNDFHDLEMDRVEREKCMKTEITILTLSSLPGVKSPKFRHDEESCTATGARMLWRLFNFPCQ